MRGHWLRQDLRTSCKTISHSTVSCLCSSPRLHNLPDGCEDCISKWWIVITSLYGATPCFEVVNEVYKLNKALYGPKQASRAWYETLYRFLLDNQYVKKIDCTLFQTYNNGDMLLVHSYVDDIIFGSRVVHKICRPHAMKIWDKYDGGMNYFLGLQVKRLTYENFINQVKYTRELINKLPRLWELTKSEKTRQKKGKHLVAEQPTWRIAITMPIIAKGGPLKREPTPTKAPVLN